MNRPRPVGKCFECESTIDRRRVALAGWRNNTILPLASLCLIAFGIGCRGPTTVDDYWVYRIRGTVRNEGSAIVPGAQVRVEAFSGPCPMYQGPPTQSPFMADQRGAYLAAFEWRGSFDGCVRVGAIHPNGAASGSAVVERQEVHLSSAQRDSLIVDVTLRMP